MSLSTENPTCLVGRNEEGGDGVLGRGVAALDPFVYRDMRWCAKCGREEQFSEMLEGNSGRGGVCLGCGDERIAGFSRVTGEVA